MGVLGCVQFGAGEDVVVAIQSADDEHLPVLQQGRRVFDAGAMQAAGGGPGTCRRIVGFGAGKEVGAVLLIQVAQVTFVVVGEGANFS